MSKKFFSVVTETGQIEYANAQINSTAVTLSEVAFGDTEFNALEDESTFIGMTGARNEVYRAPINRIYQSPEHPNWFVVEVIIPASIGDFTVTEFFIFDNSNPQKLIYAGRLAQTYKPDPVDGVVKDITYAIIVQVANVDTLNIEVDPNFTLLTKAAGDSYYAPISHVGSRGVDQHGLATQEIAGFMSTTDKIKLDTLSELTPQEALDLIVQVDGHLSGLNADMVDDFHASKNPSTSTIPVVANDKSLSILSQKFVRNIESSTHLGDETGRTILYGKDVVFLGANCYWNSVAGSWYRINESASAMLIEYNVNGSITRRTSGPGSGGIVWTGPYTLWDMGNDGAGSGLDADKLDDFHASDILKLVYAETAFCCQIDTEIPFDDTIPQVTEGTQILTVSITPKFASSYLLVEFNVPFDVGTDLYFSASRAAAALFSPQYHATNAIYAVAHDTGSGNSPNILTGKVRLLNSSTATKTFNLRVGPEPHGHMVLNGIITGTSAERLFGGVVKSVLTVREVLS